MAKYYDRIDDYMNGLLKGEALDEFEKEMSQNQSFKLAVENYNTAKDISSSLLEVDMLETLKRLKESNETESDIGGNGAREINSDTRSRVDKKPLRMNRRKWLAAASFIGLLAFTSWWTLQLGYSLDREYILANFVEPINEEATKSADSENLSILEEGIRLYSLNNFQESIEKLNLFLDSETDEKMRSVAYEWLGAAYLKRWKIGAALDAWEKSEEESAKKNLELLSSQMK